MTTRSPSRFLSRLRRSWLRAALMTAAGAGAVVLVSAVLLHEPGELPRHRPVRTPAPEAAVATDGASGAVPSAAVATRPRVVAEPAPRKKPTSVQELFAQDALLTTADLAAWTADASIDAQVRYCALRRLEEADAGAAVSSALELLDEPVPMLRLNAIALLTRANDARAKEALAKLDPKSLLMAHALCRGRAVRGRRS